MRFIFSSNKTVVATPDQKGLAYENVFFPSQDGVRLHGWLVPGKAEKPLVLFFHGDAANISDRVKNLAFLHHLGLSVFIFDYRGFGASSGVPTGEKDLDRDAKGALAFLEKRGWEPSGMIYFGRSLGAAVALQLAIETPPAGLILESPFTSLRAIARKTAPVAYALFGWWNIDNIFDNLGKIQKLKTPLLIFFGDKDKIVPEGMPLRLFARARAPKTLYLVRGAGHSNAFEVGGAGYRLAWNSFVAKVRDGKTSRSITGSRTSHVLHPAAPR